MRILVTGAAGFINGYLVPELLEAGHDVIGLDDFSKYGRLAKSYDDHPRYRFVEGDAKDAGLMRELAADCDQVVAAAAMIGGISYFHEFAYDLLAENERILAATFDGGDRGASGRAPRADHRRQQLDGLRVLDGLPDPGGRPADLAAAGLDLGFQKLASEYFAKGAWEQYQLPYTIVRPFNCVGIGERRAVRDSDIMSGNVKLALSHVVPDLVHKVLKGQDPLHILGAGTRCATTPTAVTSPRGSVSRWNHRPPSTTTSTSRPRPPRPCSSWPRHLAEDPHGRPPVPLCQRPALRARRADARPGRAQGARGPRLRGDDDARPNAREVIPWIREEVDRTTGCDRHRPRRVDASGDGEDSRVSALQGFIAELEITVTNLEVWQSVALALVLGFGCLVLGVWLTRSIGLLRTNAPAGETLGVGLAAGLMLLTAWCATIGSGGRSSFTPVAIAFAIAVALAVLMRARRPRGDATALPTTSGSAATAPVAPPDRRRLDRRSCWWPPVCSSPLAALVYGSPIADPSAARWGAARWSSATWRSTGCSGAISPRPAPSRTRPPSGFSRPSPALPSPGLVPLGWSSGRPGP